MLNDDQKNLEYEKVDLQGEIRAKDQQIGALPRRYVSHLSDEDKGNGISIIAKNNDEAGYADSMVIRGTRSGCCLHTIRVAYYLRMETYRMPLLHITFGASIG